MSGHTGPRRRRTRPTNVPAIVLGVVLVLVLAAGGALAYSVWFASTPQQIPSTPTETSAAVPTVETLGPVIVTEAELRDYAGDRGPIYWAGPRPGAQYELTRTADGTTYVRYLDPGIEAGDASDQFESVVTYERVDGYESLVLASQIAGATSVERADGALVVTNPGVPLSAYLAYSGSHVQVEIYAPEPGRALLIAASDEMAALP